MSNRILTKNGVDNTNVDGARSYDFSDGFRSGCVKGVLGGCSVSSTTNSIVVSSGEIRICGHRIVLDDAETFTFLNSPSEDTPMMIIAQISCDSNGQPTFSMYSANADHVLADDNISASATGQGTHEIAVVKFVLKSDGTLSNVVRVLNDLTGGTVQSDLAEQDDESESFVKNKKVSYLENDSGYATETYVDEKVAESAKYYDNFETPLCVDYSAGGKLYVSEINGNSKQIGTEVQNTGSTLELISCGKNILPTPTWATQTSRGITVTYDPETQIYTFNGTHDGTASFSAMICTGIIQQASNKTFSASVKYISGSVESPTRAPVLYLGNSDDGTTLSNWKNVNLLNSDNSNNNLTSAKKYIYKAWFYAANGQTFTNYKIKCQFEENATATEYEPYKSGAQTITLTDVNGNSHEMGSLDKIVRHEDGKWYFEQNSAATSSELNSAAQESLNNIAIQKPNANVYFVNKAAPTMTGKYAMDIKLYIDSKFSDLQAMALENM